MFGRKRPEAEPAAAQKPLDKAADVPPEHRAKHGEYTILPSTKQLNNGKWIVRLVLEENRDGDRRQYHYPSPMREYPSPEAAREGGVAYARRRLDERGRIRPGTLP